MRAVAPDRSKTLLTLLLLNLVASIAHYVDNILRFALYPEPSWVNPVGVDAFWFFMTPFGVAAYWLYRRGPRWLALWSSYAYGAMNLLVLGHYVVLPPWRIALDINVWIVFETAAAGLLIAYTAWIHDDDAHDALTRATT
jgi:hypothetical protein